MAISRHEMPAYGATRSIANWTLLSKIFRVFLLTSTLFHVAIMSEARAQEAENYNRQYQSDLTLLRSRVRDAESANGLISEAHMEALRSLARRLKVAPVKPPLFVDSKDQIEFANSVNLMTTIARRLHSLDQPKLAQELGVLGRYFVRAGMDDNAYPLLKESLEIFIREKTLDRDRRREAMNSLVGYYQRAGQFQRAIAILEQGEMLDGNGRIDPPNIAKGLLAHAQKFIEKQHFREAEQLAIRSTELFKQHTGETSVWVARSLITQATAQMGEGQYSSAVDSLRQAQSLLTTQEASRVADLQGQIVYLLTDSYGRLGMYELALTNCELHLSIAEAKHQKDIFEIASSKARLIRCLIDAGRFDRALPLALQVLAFTESAHRSETSYVAAALSNLGFVYEKLGQYAQALDAHKRAIALYKSATASDVNVAAAIGNLASVYSILGDTKRSLAIREKQLTLLLGSREEVRESFATALNNIGMTYLEIDRGDLAIPYFQRALAIRESLHNASHPYIAHSLAGLASAYMMTGSYALSLATNERVAQIYEKTFEEDHPVRVRHLHNQGYAYMRAGDRLTAVFTHNKVLALASNHPTNHTDIVWKSQFGLSHLYRADHQHQIAIQWGKEAVNTLQDLRAGLTSLDKDLQFSFLNNKRHIYQHLADLLIEQGRLTEAQTVLQMLKEQELHDSLERAANTDPRSTRIELTGLERKRFAKYYELRDQQLELGLERERLERKKKVGEISEAEKRRLDEINSKLLPPLRAAMVAFLEALQKSASELAKQEQRRADPDLKLAETNLQRAMQQVQRSTVGTATAALQFVVTDTRLSILLSTPGAPPLARQIEVSAKSLRQKVMAARELVSRPPGKLPAASNPEFLNKPLRELYALLIAPIEADLKSLGVKTLILVPNDVLRYVPFAALMNGDRYLVQDYTLALFNEAVKRDFAPKVSTIWRPAAMGLTRAVANLPALPAVREEVEVVALNAGMTGQAFLDDDFNRATLTKVLGQDFNVLHLASHFDLVPGRPDASRLFLGDLSALTLGDIARDNLRFDRFSLVAFSACETGLGDTELADGRDMESLGALVQNQGAQAVIATLWKADDKSAATLMELFYRGRSMAGLSKAEALRKAQLQFVAGQAAGRARSHPYFWAPFVLMGDWR
jgi:CHAT domain-containing protein/tetratricopeptide (TPR) repeat protein